MFIEEVLIFFLPSSQGAVDGFVGFKPIHLAECIVCDIEQGYKLTQTFLHLVDTDKGFFGMFNVFIIVDYFEEYVTVVTQICMEGTQKLRGDRNVYCIFG